MAPKRETIGSHVGLPLSRAVRAGGLVFCSGQVPMQEDGSLARGSIESETRFVLDALRDTLAAAGSGLDRVIKATVILAEPGDFAGFNAVYREYFPEEPPARTTFCARLLVDVRVEIDLIAEG